MGCNKLRHIDNVKWSINKRGVSLYHCGITIKKREVQGSEKLTLLLALLEMSSSSHTTSLSKENKV